MKKLLANSIAFVLMPALAQVAEIKESRSTTHAQYVEPSASTAISPRLKSTIYSEHVIIQFAHNVYYVKLRSSLIAFL